MKETILYISKSEQDIQSFLKYLQSKLKAEQKECTLDEKHDILKVPKYYDIVGKSVHGTMLGAGYGYCKPHLILRDSETTYRDCIKGLCVTVYLIKWQSGLESLSMCLTM